MKKVLVIIVSIILLVNVGVIVYGAMMGVPTDFSISTQGLGAAPTAEVVATAKYDISEKMNEKSSNVDKAIALIEYATYNHIYAKQWFFLVNDMVTKAAGSTGYCQYFRAQAGIDSFYQTAAFTGGIVNTGIRRIVYGNQKMEQEAGNTSYDNGKVLASWSNSLKKNDEEHVGSLKSETLYAIYSWFDCTLDFEQPEQISSVTITTSQDSLGNKLYTINLTVDRDVINASTESMRRLADSTKTNEASCRYFIFNLEFQIWETGFFREISYYEKWYGKSALAGDGVCETTRTFQFSYDDVDCSIANLLKTSGLDGYLTETGKAKLDAEYALIADKLAVTEE